MKWPGSQRRGQRAFARAELLDELRRPQTSADDGHLVSEPKHAKGAVLTGLDLSGADLRRAQLQRCDLRKAILNDAQLDDADLSWADLDGAQLRNVTFGQARLLDTTFRHADLSGCDFSFVTGLTPATVRGAVSTEGVKWPAGFTPTESRVIGPVLHKSP